MTTTLLVWKTRGTDPPLLNDRVPVWPSRSRRFPKVIEICGVLVASSQKANTFTPNRLGLGNVVVVDDPVVVVVVDGAVVLVVEDAVVVVVDEPVVVEVVGDVVVVLVPGCVVVVLLGYVVVVPPSGRHSLTSGLGWPVSKAITLDRPCSSANSSPTWTPSFSGSGMALTETLITTWSNSLELGMLTYLQTQTFLGASVVVGAAVVVVEEVDVVVPGAVDVVAGTVLVVVVVNVGGGGAAVVVVAPVAVVVGATVVVVVEDDGTVVLVVVVVVGTGNTQSRIDGSSWPMSKAMISERPWASVKKSPMWMPSFSGSRIEWMSTEIGFWPVWSRSSTPGVPTNLHTKTL